MTEAPTGVRRFGDLPRREQIAYLLCALDKKLEHERRGYVRYLGIANPGKRGWIYEPERAVRFVERHEARREALLDELADLILDRLAP